MSNFQSSHPRQAFQRDVYLAYLIDGARRTKIEGYPIIEGWMVPDKPPLYCYQWDHRNDVIEPSQTGMNFYCVDSKLKPILNNPKAYVEKLKGYYCIFGMDCLCQLKIQSIANRKFSHFDLYTGLKLLATGPVI